MRYYMYKVEPMVGRLTQDLSIDGVSVRIFASAPYPR